MQAAEKLSITLPSEMVRVIRTKVEQGGYGSSSEVIREAMRGWLDREQKFAALDEAIDRGVADADTDSVHTVDDVREEMRRRFGNGG
ncbi:MAG: type II toxin-antitoxin system ParD family antitoxin [Janthinobacterium lividum]